MLIGGFGLCEKPTVTRNQRTPGPDSDSEPQWSTRKQKGQTAKLLRKEQKPTFSSQEPLLRRPSLPGGAANSSAPDLEPGREACPGGRGLGENKTNPLGLQLALGLRCAWATLFKGRLHGNSLPTQRCLCERQCWQRNLSQLLANFVIPDLRT